MKLYEIHDQIQAIMDTQVNKETGELDETTVAALTELDVALETKVLATAGWVKGKLAEAEAVASEANKLKARAKTLANAAAWAINYMEFAVPKGAEFKDARSIVKWQKNPPKAIMQMGVPIPKKFQRIIPRSVEPDMKAILAALKEGVKLKCAKIEQASRLVVK